MVQAFYAVFAAFVLASASARAGDALVDGFRAPPNAAKPRVWWHWMNGNVTKAGITADLEAMAEAGIGGAQIFDVGCNVPTGEVAFNTSAWDEHLRYAIREAERLGLELTLANCSGFANAGGPWVAPSNSMFFVTCTETKVKGGSRPARPLPRTRADHGFYRDIAVLAFPEPACEAGAPEDLRITSPKANVFVFSSGRPMALRGLRVAMYLDKSWAWDRWLRLAVETSDDGEHWTSAGSLETTVIVGGKSDCNGGDEKRVAFDRPYVARFIRFTGDATHCSHCYGDSSKARVAALKPEFRCSLPELNARTLRTAQRVAPLAGDSCPGEAIVRERIVDLTAKMSSDGTLDWTAPAGENWIVLRLGYVSSGVRCHPSSKFGGGLEVDKLDADAVRRHLEAYALKYADAKSVVAVLCDSYEVAAQNWTHGFERTFERRNGYSILPYLAAFSGRLVGSAKETDRVLRDYRTTVSDLFCENFAGAMSELCARHGLKAAVESYGNGPFNDLSYGWHVSQPMTEFWIDKDDSFCTLARRVASAAHLRGYPFVDAEGFTAAPTRGGRWLKAPYDLKAWGDKMYACGVTRMVYHRWAHQPWTELARLPGMTMGPWGTHFERTETWWPMVGPWLRYQARCQFLLQQGAYAADVLVYGGDDVPAAELDLAALPEGLGWDVCCKEALAELKVKDGRLVCRSATDYAALYVPTNVWVSLESARRIAALKAQGAKVVDDVKKLGLAPDFTFHGTESPVKAIHRRYADGREGYFVASPTTNAVTVICSFRVTGKTPQLWDAESGAISSPRTWRAADGRTEVELALRPCGSVFVMFVPQEAPKPPVETRFAATASEPLEDAWTLTFPKGWNCPEKVRLAKLDSWTEIPDGEVRYFSGIVEYAYEGKVESYRLKVKGDVSSRVVLDLGEVKNVAAVTVNGKTFEPLWRPPFEVDVTDALRDDGAFDLRVRVANLWPNRLIGDAKKGEDCTWDGKALKEMPAWVRDGGKSPTGRLTFTTWRHWCAEDSLLPSGLLGPVCLSVSRPLSGETIAADSAPAGEVLKLPKEGMYLASGVNLCRGRLAWGGGYPHTEWSPVHPQKEEVPQLMAHDNQGNVIQWWEAGDNLTGCVARTYAAGMCAMANGSSASPAQIRWMREKGTWVCYDLHEFGTFTIADGDEMDLYGKTSAAVLRKYTLAKAADDLVRKARARIGRAHADGWGLLTSSSASDHLDYLMLGGLDIPGLEFYPYADTSFGMALCRGMARQYGANAWHAYLAHDWYSFVPHANPHKMDSLMMMLRQQYMAGVKVLTLESGNQWSQSNLCVDAPQTFLPPVAAKNIGRWLTDEEAHAAVTPDEALEAKRKFAWIDYRSPVVSKYRRIMCDFWDFVKANPAPKGQPEAVIALAKGHLDIASGCHTAFPVAGAYRIAQIDHHWMNGAPELSWTIVKDIFYPKPPNMLPDRNLFYSGSPYGQVDVVSFAYDRVTADFLVRNYKALVFSGWNTCTPKQYETLCEYVKRGGKLCLAIPHLSTNDRRNYDFFTKDELVNGGDFSELCGLKVKKQGDRFYWATGPAPKKNGLGLAARRRYGIMGLPLGDLEFTGPKENYELLAVDDEASRPVILRCKSGKGEVYFVNVWHYPWELNRDNGTGAFEGSKGLMGELYAYIARTTRGNVWITGSDFERPDADCAWISYSYFPEAGKICLYNLDYDHERKCILHWFGEKDFITLKPGEFRLMDAPVLEPHEMLNDVSDSAAPCRK